jgi:hypothetical protein
MELCICPLKGADIGKKKLYLGILNCVYITDLTSHPAIYLEAVDERKMKYSRIGGDILWRVSPNDLGSEETSSNYLESGYTANTLSNTHCV